MKKLLFILVFSLIPALAFSSSWIDPHGHLETGIKVNNFLIVGHEKIGVPEQTLDVDIGIGFLLWDRLDLHGGVKTQFMLGGIHTESGQKMAPFPFFASWRVGIDLRLWKSIHLGFIHQSSHAIDNWQRVMPANVLDSYDYMYVRLEF